MADWREEYRAQFCDIQSRKNEIAKLEREIMVADKRTHNGKLTKIFNTAKILALQEVEVKSNG